MDDATYALRTPATARGESITSQLQREILGDAVATPAAPEADGAPGRLSLLPQLKTPPTTRSASTTRVANARRESTSDDADLVAISTPETLSQKDAAAASQSQSQPQPQPQHTHATGRDDRRRTLSPSKALAFFSQEGIADAQLSSRRDTVSPESIRTLLQGLDESSDKGASRRASVAAALGLDPTDESIDEGVLSEYLHDVARTKQYLETSKLTMLPTSKGSKRRRSVGGAKGKDRQANEDGAADQDSFTDAFFSSKLMSRDEDDDDEDNTIDSISGGVAAKVGSERRTTLEPMDAESILSAMRSEMNGESEDNMTASGRQSLDGPTTRASSSRRQQATPSPSPNTRSRKRRATLDPNDLIVMRDTTGSGSAANAVNANRRETIGDGDLMELRREFDVEAESHESTPAAEASKRTRFNNASVADVTPRKPAGQLREDDPLFSPPPTNRTNKTPLKSCMSARKASKKDQPTPSKSVNFGPSQGAEFNLGSPSTSMTPMLAKDARAMFPLHEKTPPPSEDEEDDETSLNSSILDEADANELSGEEDNDAMEIQEHQSRLETSVSARTRRRYSLRGVSPLDNQANARRQRRLSTTSASTQRSPLVSARNRRVSEAAAAAAVAAAAAARSAVQPKTSFLSANEPPQSHSRLAYADSSASSDEGEDMEITGDYTDQAATAAALHTGVRRHSHHMSTSDAGSPHISVRRSARQDSLFVDSPLSDATVELGTLGDLLDESKMESNEGKEDGSDDDDVRMGSLSDLARESEDNKGAVAYSQENPLESIQEGDDEDRRSSSAHSMMSIESDEESDREYDEKRKTIKVNLASKFERSGTPKDKQSRDRRGESTSSLKKRRLRASVAAPPPALPAPSPAKLPDRLTIRQVLSKIQLDDISIEAVEAIDTSLLPSDVQRSCVVHATAGDLRFATNEISSWCMGLVDSLEAHAEEKLARVFSTEDDIVAQSKVSEAIQSLQAMEIVHVRSGYCQWRSKLEKRICDGLVQCENNLQSDAKALRVTLANDRAHRESELRAIKELMERERQIEQLLDGIEEQQAVQREYLGSVQTLETQCSSLSLEASVLDQQLASLTLSSPPLDRSDATEMQLREEVLALEEVLAVRESVGLWRVLSASPSKLVIGSRFDDVLFSVEVRVVVAMGSTQHASIRVDSSVFPKTRRSEDGIESDVVASLASAMLNKEQLEAYDAAAVDVSQLPIKLSALSTALRRAYQYLSDLRTISTMCGLRYTTDETQMVWIDFVRFPRVLVDGTVIDGLKFSVGHDVTLEWPFTTFDRRVEVNYGTVAAEKIEQQVDEISAHGSSPHEYLSRVCRRLHSVFIQND